MRFLFNISVLTFCIVNALVSSYTVPDASVEILKPKGFRISLPHEEGINEVSFNVKINQRINIYQPGDFAAIITERTDNVWAFDNINSRVKVGDQINYWVHVRFGNGKILREIGVVRVSANTMEISNTCPEIESQQQQCPAVDGGKVECEKSPTTINGKQMCRNELLFEDHFDRLDWSKWNQEVRIPQSSDDGQFVMFLNKPKNCFARNGQLHIIPSLASEVLGNDLKKFRTGSYQIGAECTGFLDKSQECSRKAQFYQILPPVVSARINTKHFFSFRYGRVEIKAKLPKGDWLFPLILLEPLENYYGIKNYQSGQIRIAFNRGNEVLQDANYTDISNKILYGGVVMSNVDQHRNYFLRGTKLDWDLSNEFHIYTLVWTEHQFILGIDGQVYTQNFKEDFPKWMESFHGKTKVTSKMAPFDREFYLSLGVSVGGHSDFPDDSRNGFERLPKPWTNGDPKAELYFWKDYENWSRTWNSDASGLHVDYVKVYAL
ncbi:beta-1,3-glucan-binding protein-like [Episyrphus balteatus]|uniref:beta-1,3-glucan-binding protein-like n=1 Tax=Episyrphus balteatus TaxID=286459 RepID=UPI0024860A6B|nr:beta-1,3-glucan-binding protein-like [Episyrphus balteatus]